MVKSEPASMDDKKSVDVTEPMDIDTHDVSVGMEQRRTCFMLMKKFSKEVSVIDVDPKHVYCMRL